MTVVAYGSADAWPIAGFLHLTLAYDYKRKSLTKEIINGARKLKDCALLQTGKCSRTQKRK